MVGYVILGSKDNRYFKRIYESSCSNRRQGEDRRDTIPTTRYYYRSQDVYI